MGSINSVYLDSNKFVYVKVKPTIYQDIDNNRKEIIIKNKEDKLLFFTHFNISNADY